MCTYVVLCVSTEPFPCYLFTQNLLHWNNLTISLTLRSLLCIPSDNNTNNNNNKDETKTIYFLNNIMFINYLYKIAVICLIKWIVE